MTIGRIIFWIVVVWIAIWVFHHPATANLDVHNAWHVIFGSAG